jgi:hyperosmotically inducible protein
MMPHRISDRRVIRGGVLAKPRHALLIAGAVCAALLVLTGCEQKQTQAPAASKQAQAGIEKQPAPAPAVESTKPPVAGETPGQSTTRSVGTAIDDSGITMRVRSALVADPDVKSLDVTVETRKGEVQLSGFVDSQAQIDRAVDIARRIQGVSAVQNKLALKTPGTVGSKVDDAVISAKVKAAFIRDDNIKALDIAVNTNNGEVQLSGYVANETQVSRATEVARAVEGVKSVDNKMSVKR